MARFSPQDLDDIKARNPLEQIAGQYVQLRRAGGRLTGPCPICGGKVTSQRFEVLADGENWVCAVCPDGDDVIRLVEKVEGCLFRDAIERLGGRTTVDPAQAKALFEAREKKRLAREKTAATYREADRKRLFKKWQSAIAIPDTPVSRYLSGRGIQLPARCPGLRYLPSEPYWHGDIVDSRGHKSPRQIHSGPAMVAAFIRPDGKFGGLHTTWLEDYGCRLEPVDGGEQQTVRLFRKLELSDPDSGEVLNSKKMRGSKTGAFILVAPAIEDPDKPRRMTIGEGIETVGSVFTAFLKARRPIGDMEFRAAGDLGNVGGRATETVKHPTLKRPNGSAIRVPGPMPDPDDSGLAIPDSVEELILLGDGDSDPFLTECAMIRAARRYRKDGRVIRIAFAPNGQDFNDVLRTGVAA